MVSVCLCVPPKAVIYEIENFPGKNLLFPGNCRKLSADFHGGFQMHPLSYESKFMQALLVIADYIILNLLFVLCCIPVFTIGAAQSALYSGIRVAMDPENDANCIKAFFKGFKSGFGQVTLVWCGLLVIMILLGVNLGAVIAYSLDDSAAPVIISVISMVLCAIFQSTLTPFHAKFGSPSVKQLIRNIWFVTVGHPLRSIAVTLLMWLPFAVALIDLYLFMRLGLIWLAGYYSLAALFSTFVMQKTYQKLEENFLAAQAENTADT
jgi:uncharacterized membrane protein YesL